MNPMKTVRLSKVTLNMCTGEPGPKLEKARKLLEAISGRKVVITKTRNRNTFGVAKGREIGAMTTLRGKDARELLARLLKGVENRLKASQFDSSGNFSFGVAEYINIPGIAYDPEIGIMGLDVCVTLERPGYRVSRRRQKTGRVGKGHVVTDREAIEWVGREYGTQVA